MNASISLAELILSLQTLLSEMLLLYIPMLVAEIALAVILGFCVYYHARSLGNRKAAMWGILSGLFSLAALVYLIVQIASKPKPLYCARCGCPVTASDACCPQCGAPLCPTADAIDGETVVRLKRRSRILLIVWIVLYVAMLILSFVILNRSLNSMFELFTTLVQRAGL
ncbi:MAG: hypothetical protein ACI39E_06660 [Acutalibacteraceae bacterium]